MTQLWNVTGQSEKPSKYFTYKYEMKQLSESSLSRVWQHFADNRKSCALLTAFRGEYDYETNTRRNHDLAAKIRNLGYGFIFVDGFWVENAGTANEIHVSEDSVFVNASADDDSFADKMHSLANEYRQDAVLVKDNRSTRLIFSDGNTQVLGRVQPGKMGVMYTKLRNNKKANTFVFASERDDCGFLKRLSILAGIKK